MSQSIDGKKKEHKCGKRFTAFKEEKWEVDMLDAMWSFLQLGGIKSNYPALKKACMEMRQMMLQKTAGQRKNKPNDIPFESLARVKNTIICEAMAFVISGDYEQRGENNGGRTSL